MFEFGLVECFVKFGTRAARPVETGGWASSEVHLIESGHGVQLTVPTGVLNCLFEDRSVQTELAQTECDKHWSNRCAPKRDTLIAVW